MVPFPVPVAVPVLKWSSGSDSGVVVAKKNSGSDSQNQTWFQFGFN
jgi:hypothetical protein